MLAPNKGIVTASFGGVLCDILFAGVSGVFMPSQLYVTAAAVGVIVYVILLFFGVDETPAFLTCFVLTFIVRLLAFKFNIQTC